MNHAWHTQNKSIFMTLIWLPNWSMTFTPCTLCHVFCGRMTPMTAFRVLLYLWGAMVSSGDPSQYKNNLFEMNCHHSEPGPSRSSPVPVFCPLTETSNVCNDWAFLRESDIMDTQDWILAPTTAREPTPVQFQPLCLWFYLVSKGQAFFQGNPRLGARETPPLGREGRQKHSNN